MIQTTQLQRLQHKYPVHEELLNATVPLKLL